MRAHAAEVLDVLEHAPGSIAIGHDRPLEAGQEALGMFMVATGPVFEQHNWLLAVDRRALVSRTQLLAPGPLKTVRGSFPAYSSSPCKGILSTPVFITSVPAYY